MNQIFIKILSSAKCEYTIVSALTWPFFWSLSFENWRRIDELSVCCVSSCGYRTCHTIKILKCETQWIRFSSENCRMQYVFTWLWPPLKDSSFDPYLLKIGEELMNWVFAVCRVVGLEPHYQDSKMWAQRNQIFINNLSSAKCEYMIVTAFTRRFFRFLSFENWRRIDEWSVFCVSSCGSRTGHTIKTQNCEPQWIRFSSLGCLMKNVNIWV
jgi:hypothetical protein